MLFSRSQPGHNQTVYCVLSDEKTSFIPAMLGADFLINFILPPWKGLPAGGPFFFCLYAPGKESLPYSPSKPGRQATFP